MNEKKVLIVEDESVVALMLEESLSRIGYHVVGVTARGEDAVRIAGERKPDVVIMDINLKGTMDGISAADMILCKLDIPVIYLTAYTDDETVLRAAKTDSCSYLVKPINMRELFANIELAINRRWRDRRPQVLLTGSPPTCRCGEKMVRAFSAGVARMIPVGWICPTCQCFQPEAPGRDQIIPE